MASTMIHYVIAQQLMEHMSVEEKERFILAASIAPDASRHDDGTYDKAHYCVELEKEKLRGFNWKAFSDKYHDIILLDSFYLGYMCHLIQDAIWYHDMYGKYVRNFLTEKNEKIHMMYRDYERLNSLLIEEFKYQAPKESITIPTINEITQERFDEIFHNMEGFFNYGTYHKEDLEIFHWDIVIEYIDKCVDLCICEIEALKNNCDGTSPKELFLRKQRS